MQYSTLYDLLAFLQCGTQLHIGVLCLGSFGGSAFQLPHSQTIHASPVCWEFKGREGGNRRCFRCRQLAIKKCLREKRDFGGFCVNGIYEYTRPVMIDGECVAIIFIGNIDAPGGDGRLQRLLGERSDLRGTMEHDFDEERCRAMGRLIESYLHALWEQQGKVGGDESPSLIENIISYVSANLECDVRLSEVAQLFHYNEQYLGRLFKHKTGMRFSEYLNRERLKRAALYLGDGESVTRAAYQVGFRNVTYFNRVFRAYYGKSPTDYKQENEQKLQL